MGLFGNPRKNIDKWAPIVMEGYVPGMPVDEKFLDAATELYICQRVIIMYESIDLILTSKNPETRKGRYELASKHYGALSKVYKYANKQQKKVLDQVMDDFMIMDDQY